MEYIRWWFLTLPCLTIDAAVCYEIQSQNLAIIKFLSWTLVCFQLWIWFDRTNFKTSQSSTYRAQCLVETKFHKILCIVQVRTLPQMTSFNSTDKTINVIHTYSTLFRIYTFRFSYTLCLISITIKFIQVLNGFCCDWIDNDTKSFWFTDLIVSIYNCIKLKMFIEMRQYETDLLTQWRIWKCWPFSLVNFISYRSFYHFRLDFVIIRCYNQFKLDVDLGRFKQKWFRFKFAHRSSLYSL